MADRMETVRERMLMINSLTCLLRAMEGWITTIEFRNETKVSGKVVSVDYLMNTQMEDCVFTKLDGTSVNFDNFYIQGKNIRYVHIPDEMDIMRAIKGQVLRFNQRLASRKVKTRVDYKKRSLLQKLDKAQKKMESIKTDGKVQDVKKD